MQLLCHLFAVRHGIEQPGACVLGMAGHKPQPKIARHGVQTAQQIGKVNIQPQILAVGVDVLAKQGDLFVPRCDQLAQLLFDLLRAAAALAAAHIGDDTVGAEVVAAIHNGQPRLCAARAQHGQALGNVILPADIEYALLPAQHTVQQRWEAPQRMRAEQQADLRIAFFDLLDVFLLLRHAAAQRNDNLRPPLFQMAERADVAECAVLRMLTHRAGVEQDKIRFIDIIGHFITHFVQHAADAFGIRLVLLAAESMGIGAQALVADERCDRVDIGKLVLQLFLGNSNWGGHGLPPLIGMGCRPP